MHFINESSDLAHYYGHFTPPTDVQSSPPYFDDYFSLASSPSNVNLTPIVTTYDYRQILSSPVTETIDTGTELRSKQDAGYRVSLREEYKQPPRLRYDSETSKPWYSPQRTASLRGNRITRPMTIESSGISALLDHKFSNNPHLTSPNFTTFWSNSDVQEAYLMRYFVEELAQWVRSQGLINTPNGPAITHHKN